MARGAAAGDPAGLPAALRAPSAWPVPVDRVDVIETHLSWVFLAGREAWKLKKPAGPDGHGLRTAGARRRHLLQELRLNRRLAPDVYLGVEPVALGADGLLHVGGTGMPVDWLLRMRRLPADAMLDARLRDGRADAADMRRIARRLHAFQCGLPPAPIDGAAWRSLLTRQLAASQAVLADPAFGLPGVDALCSGQRRWIAAHAAMLDDRIARGRVVEGHGDLRPEHVCLAEPLAIIDCLEFSRELRTLDCADEVAYLALECERAGAPALGEALLAEWVRASGDPVPAALLHFFRSCRARTRAHLAIAHWREARYRTEPRWRVQALQGLDLAAEHLRRADQVACASSSTSDPPA